MPVLVFEGAPPDVLAPGIARARFAPGGKDGPDGVVRDSEQPGGCTWSQIYSLGRHDDEWRMAIPDIRMAANQVWPLHWHDCWTAVIVLDGTLLMGDWWMSRGDVLIAAPGAEYGLLLNGPHGCRLLEVFARDVLSPGGYGEEYRDHPTLVHLKGVESTTFVSRPPALVENGRRQVVPVDGAPGLAKGHLDGAGRWNLGEADDPDRGIVFDRRLDAGATIPPAPTPDWRAVLVLDGSMRVGDDEFVADDMLVVEPDARVPSVTVGGDGVHLLTLLRTAGEPAY